MAFIGETGAIEAGLVKASKALAGKEVVIIPVLMVIFSVMGAIIGSAEDLLPYIPICVSLCLALGFDSITGTAIVLCGGAAGFAGAFLNPYTEGVAQSIAGLPMFSGLGYRLVVYGCLVLLTITFVFIYARRVKKNPQLSPMYQIDQAREDKLELDEGTHPFGMRQKLILIALAITVGLLAYGTIQWGWYFEQIAGLFFGLGIVSAILGGLSVNQFANAMGRGMADIATGALVCGFARGIMVVLTDGNIIHTILHATANVLMKLPSVISAIGMYIFSACSILSFRQEADRRQYLCQSWRRFRTWSVLQDRQPHWHSNWAMAFPTSLRRRLDISWRHLLWQRFHGKNGQNGFCL